MKRIIKSFLLAALFVLSLNFVLAQGIFIEIPGTEDKTNDKIYLDSFTGSAIIEGKGVTTKCSQSLSTQSQSQIKIDAFGKSFCIIKEKNKESSKENCFKFIESSYDYIRISSGKSEESCEDVELGGKPITLEIQLEDAKTSVSKSCDEIPEKFDKFDDNGILIVNIESDLYLTKTAISSDGFGISIAAEKGKTLFLPEILAKRFMQIKDGSVLHYLFPQADNYLCQENTDKNTDNLNDGPSDKILKPNMKYIGTT